MRTILLCLLLISTKPVLAEKTVLAFSGSTRKESYNQKLVNEASELAKSFGAKVSIIYLSDFPIPFYDADLEAKIGLPPNAKKLRDLMIASDAIIISTPEYNASISAVLKNCLDWASRNEVGEPSREAFLGKRFCLMSASLGAGGGIRALTHLRAIIEDIGGNVISKQFTLGAAHAYFAETGRDENSDLQEMVKELLNVQ